MKIKYLTPGVVLLLLCLSGHAQKNPRLPNPNVTREYDRFRDETTVRFKAGYIRNAEPRMTLDLLAQLSGQSGALSNPFIALVFISDSKDWEFLRGDNTLRVIIDEGKPKVLGELKRVDSRVIHGGVVESLMLLVKPEVIEELSKARKVEMKISLSEFELTAGQIAGLDDFLSTVRAKP
jgi:hypothetical protein